MNIQIIHNNGCFVDENTKHKNACFPIALSQVTNIKPKKIMHMLHMKRGRMFDLNNPQHEDGLIQFCCKYKCAVIILKATTIDGQFDKDPAYYIIPEKLDRTVHIIWYGNHFELIRMISTSGTP